MRYCFVEQCSDPLIDTRDVNLAGRVFPDSNAGHFLQQKFRIDKKVVCKSGMNTDIEGQ